MTVSADSASNTLWKNILIEASFFFYKVPAKLRKKRKNPFNDRTFDCQLPRTHQGLHMERTGNIRLSRHQMFAILPLKRNLIVLQIEKRRLICHQSETLSPLPAHFFFPFFFFNQSQTSRRSEDWWPARIWWLTLVIKHRRGGRETLTMSVSDTGPKLVT